MIRHINDRPFSLRVILLALLTTVPGVTCAEDDHAMTKADVDQLVVELSNWGRWGKEDQLGTLNLITPEKRKAAVKLVRDGISVSLARDVEKEQTADNPSPFVHEMLLFGRGTDNQWAADRYSVNYHGFVHTHMDSLCHFFYNDKLYNGFTRDQVGPAGAETLAIRNIKDGILTRGILVDIPRLRGVRFLEPGTPIYPEELDAWEKFAKVKVSSGDVIFIRTGRWARREISGPWDVERDGVAGLHASCGKWLRQRDIAMLGSDACSDVIPSGIEGMGFPVHLLTLHVMGVHIFDNCDLRDLSTTAERLGRYEFLLTASPLPVGGGTGSPLNPIATF